MYVQCVCVYIHVHIDAGWLETEESDRPGGPSSQCRHSAVHWATSFISRTGKFSTNTRFHFQASYYPDAVERYEQQVQGQSLHPVHERHRYTSIYWHVNLYAHISKNYYYVRMNSVICIRTQSWTADRLNLFLLLHVPVAGKMTVTSSDNQLTVVCIPRIARKNSQRRRPRAERTTAKKM